MAGGSSELINIFRHAAEGRGITGAITPPMMFKLVRDMPYRRPSRLDAATTIAEWCGTCSTKHRLLQDLFSASGITTRLMVATYRYRWTTGGLPPDELAAILEEGPVPDVHNFLTVLSPEGWLLLDATWPLAGRRLGFPANETGRLGLAHEVACTPPYQAWLVPEGADLALYKRKVTEAWCGSELPRRERFIAALSNVASKIGID
jgi:hypothetical protein